jgi:hypothetical protein
MMNPKNAVKENGKADQIEQILRLVVGKGTNTNLDNAAILATEFIKNNEKPKDTDALTSEVMPSLRKASMNPKTVRPAIRAAVALRGLNMDLSEMSTPKMADAFMDTLLNDIKGIAKGAEDTKTRHSPDKILDLIKDGKLDEAAVILANPRKIEGGKKALKPYVPAMIEELHKYAAKPETVLPVLRIVVTLPISKKDSLNVLEVLDDDGLVVAFRQAVQKDIAKIKDESEIAVIRREDLEEE